MFTTRYPLRPVNGLVTIHMAYKFRVLRVEQKGNGGELIIESNERSGSSMHGFLVTSEPQNHELPHPRVPGQRKLGSFCSGRTTFEVWGCDRPA